jgi:hypothetical protein
MATKKMVHTAISLSTAFILALASFTYSCNSQTLNPQQLNLNLTGCCQKFKPAKRMCALVAKNGRIIYKKAFGMADLELNVPMQPIWFSVWIHYKTIYSCCNIADGTGQAVASG